jgi:LysR family transcriptional regulator, glycine cleavage system transcriptional activator
MAKAAAEMGVSPPSVTHHLQTLEEFLGVKLVTRTANSISLTQKGEAYSEAIRNGFDILAMATDLLSQKEVDDPLSISCVPTLGNSWFASQLNELEKQMPGLVIQCDFSPVPVDFEQNRLDLAIRYGVGEYPYADSELLFVDKLAPVCTPELARRIREPDDLLSVIRLRSSETTPEGRSLWYHWGAACFGEAFAERIDTATGPVLSSSRFLVEALKASNHISIVDYVTANEELKRGALVSPFDNWVDAPFGYYLLTPKRRAPRIATRHLKSLMKQNLHLIQMA